MLQIYSLIYFIITCLITHFTLKLFADNPSKNKPLLIIWKSNIVPNVDREIQCYDNKYQCIISRNDTKNNVSAYLFYGSHLDLNNFPLPRNKEIWGLFHEESPRNYASILFKEIQRLFNITSTFSRYSDFPLTLQYLPDINSIIDKTYFKTTKEKNAIKKAKNISSVLFIQSDCDTPLERDKIIEKLMKFIKIDSYGTCLNNKKFPDSISSIHPLDLYNSTFLHFISQYKFTISFENAICNDYITEKLWRPLLVGSVPIYLGSPTIKDWLPNEKSAILARDFDSLEPLAGFLNFVDENDVFYDEFLQHKIEGIVKNKVLLEKYNSGDYGLNNEDINAIMSFECVVCKKLYEKDFKNLEKESIFDCDYPEKSSWKGFWDIGKYQARTLEILMKENVEFNNDDYEKLWKKLFNEKN